MILSIVGITPWRNDQNLIVPVLRERKVTRLDKWPKISFTKEVFPHAEIIEEQ